MDIRDEIVEAVIREIIGPSPNHNYIDEESGEEILLASVHGSPKSRYGAGMLYPQQSVNNEVENSLNQDEINFDEDIPVTENAEIEERNRNSSITEKGGNDEEPVGLANQYLPSAMGFTIRLKSGESDDQINLEIKSAYYEKGKGQIAKKRLDSNDEIITPESNGSPFLTDYWIRRPIKQEIIPIRIYEIFNDGKKSYDKVLKKFIDDSNWLKLRIFNRTTNQDKDEGFLTYTFVLINEAVSTTDDSINSNKILYQNELALSTDNSELIVPYREKNSSTDTDEESELNLLYRKKRFFAIGHGTSVSWETLLKEDHEIVNKIKTSTIPVYDLPQVAPTSYVDLSMLELSDMGNWKIAKNRLLTLTTEYCKWIDEIEQQTLELGNYEEAAIANVKKCKASLERIQKGINYLLEAKEDSDIVKCFRWMNRAMIWQQQRSKTKLRKWIKVGTGINEKLVLEGIDNKQDVFEFPSIEQFHETSPYNGRWRPFQLAFILMNIDSIVNPKAEERKIVDLIWFPTGGGKTEAYLGLTAFSIFYRRIKGKTEWNWDFYGGTTVLMRYTLRLLTTQQYERAASLICACDIIRKKNESDLGTESISIGLWVGGESTPNSNADARNQFNQLIANNDTAYHFIVMKCPCCGSQIGKVDQPIKNIRIKGLRREDGNDGKVLFQCDNNSCEYSKIALPLQVVDEHIYENPPTLLLGTVDKFAMIPWRKESGSIFGFRYHNEKWTRLNPPELIIQDELHLIAGPLGTMVGLYESMIQTLCNNYDKSKAPFILPDENDFIPPKIIASSATISRAYEQVKSLYGIKTKEQLNIFPAQGLEFGDTWFSKEKSLNERDENGKQKFPGRKYIGILASGYPSAQTAIVRSYSAVLQKVKELTSTNSKEQIDYYWTLLGYFNSIRELGGASSLVYGDIRERLGQIQNRDLIKKPEKRFINRIEELTSRISSAEIPNTLKKLEEPFSNDKNRALDICLATNMVATGVDISRLGLMFIHGQPKTTAEYIQASSRVGRKLPDGSGIIFTLYSPSKPRDKSQYEQFQGYHSRIYSNVEPTSVTPFSINARERGLHAILIGLVRHFSSGLLKNYPITKNDEFEVNVRIISELLIARCQEIDPDEVTNTRELIAKIIRFWKKGFQNYGDAGNYGILNNEGYFPLMYSNSAEVKDEIVLDKRSLSTPTSMRGVDTESMLSIYSNNE